MEPWLSRYDYTLDESLADKIIMPGFIEPHSHMYMSAGFISVTYIGPPDWPGRNGMQQGSPTHADVLATLKKAHEDEADPAKRLIARGFDPANHGGALNRDELDAITTDLPIFVIGFAPHFAYLNSPAIEATGIKPDTTIHGVFKKADGSLSGVFNENAAVQHAFAPVFSTIIELGGVDGLGFMASIAQKAGVTTVADLMYGGIDFDVEWKDTLAATNDPDFPVRIQLVADGFSMDQKYGDKKLDA